MRRVVGTTFLFLSDPSAPDPVLEWFRCLPSPPEAIESARGTWFYFRDIGPIVNAPDGSVDVHRTPLASLLPPLVRRGVLWTVGELHFLPAGATFPALRRINAAFRKWLQAFECISKVSQRNEWDYYLEGSAKSGSLPIFALPAGLEALRRGQYFVAERDNDFVLDKVCARLRLRDVHCR
jgi:hypothetical protein